MTYHTCGENIICLVDEISALIDAINGAISNTGYEIYHASDLSDVIASWSSVVIVQEELLEQWFLDTVTEMMTDSIDEVDEFVTGLQTVFIVVGGGTSIPVEMSEFVKLISRQDFSSLAQVIPPKLPCKECTYDDELDLTIDSSSDIQIQQSFERIANELFSSWLLLIGRRMFLLTEVEFYYFKGELHEDKSVHEHEVKRGRWRFHSQGLDISLGYDEDYDGGVLIRGIRSRLESVNGPRRVLSRIFEGFDPVNRVNNYFGLVRTKNPRRFKMYKTVRQGVGSSYAGKLYRYYCDVELWNANHYSAKGWQLLRGNSEQVHSR
jgi:hypothetical protein